VGGGRDDHVRHHRVDRLRPRHASLLPALQQAPRLRQAHVSWPTTPPKPCTLFLLPPRTPALPLEPRGRLCNISVAGRRFNQVFSVQALAKIISVRSGSVESQLVASSTAAAALVASAFPPWCVRSGRVEHTARPNTASDALRPGAGLASPVVRLAQNSLLEPSFHTDTSRRPFARAVVATDEHSVTVRIYPALA